MADDFQRHTSAAVRTIVAEDFAMILGRNQQRDAYLVRQTLTGDRDAYGELVERHISTAAAFALSRLRTRADAEDITQESFVRAFEKLDTLREPAKFGPWLFGIIRNCAARLQEKRRPESPLDQADEPSAAAADFARKEIFEELRRLIDTLPITQREIVVLHYFSGKTCREIAPLLDMSSSAVRKQLQRARKQLGNKMLEQASSRFEWDSDLLKKTLVLVAATSVAWMGTTASAATSGASSGLTFFSLPKLAIGAAVLAAAGLIAVKALRQVPPDGESSVAATIPIQVASAATNDVPPIASIPEERTSTAPTSPSVSTEPPHTASEGFSFAGFLNDTHGNPVPNATVSLRITEDLFAMDRHPLLRPTLSVATTKSDSNGMFVLEGLNAGGRLQLTGEIEAESPGHFGFNRVMLSGIANIDRGFNVDVRETEPLAGVVVDERGAPVPGAVLRPLDYETREASTTWVMPDLRAVAAGVDGRFSTHHLYAGRWKFLVSAPGFASQETDFIETGDTTLELKLKRGIRLRGRVRILGDADPKVLRFALFSKDQYYEFHLADADASTGEVTFDSLRPGTYFLSIDDPSLVIVGDEKIEIADGPREVTRDIEIAEGGTIEGRLIDATTREGISGVQAVAIEQSSNNGNPRPARRSAFTDDNGQYRIVGLRRGNTNLFWMAHPSIPPIEDGRNWPAHAVKVDFGQTVSVADWPIARKFQLKGKVLDPAGAPAANAVVELRPRGDGAEQLLALSGNMGYAFHPANDRGEFAVYFAEPIDYLHLRAHAHGMVSPESGPFNVGTSTRDVELKLESAGSISGRLLGRAAQVEYLQGFTATGAATGPILRAVYGESTNGRGHLSLVPQLASSSTGRFYLGPLVADTYTLATKENPQGITIALGAGERRTDVDLALYAPTAQTITGRVTMHGQPASNCQVTYRGEFARTADNGEFTVAASGEAKDAHVRQSRKTKGVELAWELDVSGDSPVLRKQPLVFELGRGPSSVDGRVLRNGHPFQMANVIVTIDWADGTRETIRSQTDSEGRYRLEGLPEGGNQIRIAGYSSPSVDRTLQPIEIQLAAGHNAGRDIHLDSGILKVDVQGIAQGELGILRLIPGTTVVTALNEDVVEKMRNEAAIEIQLESNGLRGVDVFQEGQYVLYVAAYDAAARGMQAVLASVRFQAVPIEIVANQSTNLTVDIANGSGPIEMAPLPH